jgi:hypothetical protein
MSCVSLIDCRSPAIGNQFLGQIATWLHIFAQFGLDPRQSIPIRPDVDFAIDHFDQDGIAI